MIPLLAIVGPTAVGKTEISIKVAEQLKGEIISADSMQVYKYMDIGTAKPSKDELKTITHHLIDVVEPFTNYNVAKFQEDSYRLINDIHERKNTPMLVGGTGLYINAVVYGYHFSKEGNSIAIREELNEEAKEKGSLVLYNKLKNIDSISADKIHPNDLRRIIRALEVFYLTGKTITEQVGESDIVKSKFETLIIGLNRPRKDLYDKINLRVDKMINEGLLEETKTLLEKKYCSNLKPLQSLGYKQMIKHIKGELTYDDAIYEIKRDTRRFAKRQLTWFKKDKRIIWLNLENNTYKEKQNVIKKICSLAAGELYLNLE